MELKLPIMIVNFKAYEQAIGQNAVNLAKICEKVANETGKSIAVAVQDADMYRVSQSVNIPVFAQHLEPISFGSHTGHDIPEDIKESGAVGTLINHSENRMQIDQIEEAIKKSKELEIVSVVCANDPDTAKAIASFNPEIIAVEPPELIGGDVSVSTAKPEVVSNSVAKVHEIAQIPVLCGAGVNSKEDVAKALELGSQGVLVASAIAKSKDPEPVIRAMVEPF